MKEQEVKEQMLRITRFNELSKMRKDIHAAIEAITGDDETGQCGKGPFTGNTRESRRVISMQLKFTATRGGAPAVDKFLSDLYIEAWEFGQAVVGMLRAKLDVVNAEIEKL